MRRFTVARDAVDGGRVAFDAAESHHLRRVLRLRPGDTVLATDGAGRDYTVRLDRLGARAVGTIVADAAGSAESPLAVTLVQGVPKGDKMETVIRMATELGVARVMPALTERTVVRMEATRWQERARRWQRVARESAKQSRRAVIPEIDSPRALGQCLAAAGPADVALGAWEHAQESLRRALTAVVAPRSAVVLVGPEGGLTPREADAARVAGYTLVSLGPRTLRTETAGPALVAILQARFGDLAGG